MPKRLILTRHAKSAWDAPVDDHARTLNARGRRSADAIGAWLAERGHIPDAIHSSDAARTVETTERIKAAMGREDIAATFHPKMYHAAPATLMRVLHEATSDTVMLVAHNPGIAFFAETVVASPPDHERFFDYPTCATLVCDFPITDWADAVPRSAQVVDFIVPRDLTD